MLLALATIVALELGARAASAVWPERWPASETLLAVANESQEDPERPNRGNVLHPYVGFVRNPAELSERRVNALLVDEPVNPLGYFGRSALAPRPEGTIRIALTGGSVAEELYLYARDVLREELSAADGWTNRDIEIVSVALAGHKQPQQLLALSYLFALDAPIDVVVNVDGFNEVVLPFTDNVRMGLSPVYPFRWGAVASHGLDPDVARHVVAIEQARSDSDRMRARLADSALRRSRFVQILSHTVASRSESEATAHEEALRDRLGKDDVLPDGLRGPDLKTGDLASLFSRSVRIWSRSSRQLAALCRAEGVEYLHFLQPNQYVKGSKPLAPVERRIAILAEDSSTRFGAETGYPLLRAEGVRLRDAGVPFFDVTGLFAEVVEPVYRDGCCHYLLPGYQQLARRIAQEIAAALPAPN